VVQEKSASFAASQQDLQLSPCFSGPGKTLPLAVGDRRPHPWGRGGRGSVHPGRGVLHKGPSESAPCTKVLPSPGPCSSRAAAEHQPCTRCAEQPGCTVLLPRQEMRLDSALSAEVEMSVVKWALSSTLEVKRMCW